MVDKIVAVTAFDTEVAFVDRCIVIRSNANNFVISDIEIKITSGATIGARCFDLLDICGPP
jgi:hypothetical protein